MRGAAIQKHCAVWQHAYGRWLGCPRHPCCARGPEAVNLRTAAMLRLGRLRFLLVALRVVKMLLKFMFLGQMQFTKT